MIRGALCDEPERGERREARERERNMNTQINRKYGVEGAIVHRSKYGSNKTMSGNLSILLELAAKQNIDVDKEPIIIHPHVSKKFLNTSISPNTVPCITAARGSRPFWVTNRKRMLTLPEVCRFMGFDPVQIEIDRSTSDMTRGQMGEAVGNAMHIDDLKALIPNVLVSVGLMPRL